MDEQTNISSTCKNCNNELPLNAGYCPNCGQTTKNKKIGIKDLLFDLFNNLVIFDFKIFRSLFAILIPGKLTKEFFSGRHGRYTSPWRLFFVAIVLMLIFININNSLKENKGKYTTLNNDKTKKHKGFYFNLDEENEVNLGFSDIMDKNNPLKTKGDSLINELQKVSEKAELDSIMKKISKDSMISKFNPNSITKSIAKKFKKRTFKINSLKKYLSEKDYNNVIKVFSAFDSTFYHGDSLIRLATDSTAYTFKNQLKDMFIDSMSLFNKRISLYDKNTLSKKELLRKYNIKKKDFINKIKDDINYKFNAGKVSKSDFIDFALNNLNWFIIFLMPFAAFIFKLLYIRRKRFFVEHLVFNLHNHTAILFIFTLAILFRWIKSDGLNSVLTIITIWMPAIYYLLAMKRYYSQSWIKTIFKFLSFSFLYFILLMFATVIFGLIAAVFV